MKVDICVRDSISLNPISNVFVNVGLEDTAGREVNIVKGKFMTNREGRFLLECNIPEIEHGFMYDSWFVNMSMPGYIPFSKKFSLYQDRYTGDVIIDKIRDSFVGNSKS